MPGDNLSFWGVKLYADFRLCRGVSTRNPPVAQGSHVLTLKGSLHQGQLPKNWNALTSVAVIIPVTQQKTPPIHPGSHPALVPWPCLPSRGFSLPLHSAPPPPWCCEVPTGSRGLCKGAHGISHLAWRDRPPWPLGSGWPITAVAPSTWRVTPLVVKAQEKSGHIRGPEGPPVPKLLPAPPLCALLQKPFLAKPLLNRLWPPTFNISPGTHEATMGRTAAPHIPGQSRAGHPKGARRHTVELLPAHISPWVYFQTEETQKRRPRHLESIAAMKRSPRHSTWAG